jgi:hypothetical protein
MRIYSAAREQTLNPSAETLTGVKISINQLLMNDLEQASEEPSHPKTLKIRTMAPARNPRSA